MLRQSAQYARDLAESFGGAWTRFWFTPTSGWTLGAIRVLAGLAALYLHLTFTPDLVRLFGAGGLLPKETVNELGGWTAFSYFHLLSTPVELWAAHTLGLAVLVLFTVGLFTRATSILALVVALAYVHRGPVLTSQVEPIMTFVLFYLCLGPSGMRLSLDAMWARRKAGSKPQPAATEQHADRWGATVATRLIQLHIAAVYLAMAVGKLTAVSVFEEQVSKVWWTGNAVWDLIAKPESRLLDLTWLHSWPLLIAVWTHAIVAFELGFGIFIWNRWARPLLLAAVVPMWATLAVVTGHVSFCVWMMIASLSFVPNQAIRRLFERNQPAAAEPASLGLAQRGV